MKKCVSLLMALLLTGLFTAAAESEAGYTFDIYEINKYGNVVLNVYGNTFADLGFEFGDLITVEAAGRVLEMPVGSSYTDVDDGQYVCRVVLSEEIERSAVVLAMKNGDMAAEAGITADMPITVALRQKGGYLDEYLRRQLVRSNAREDYPALSDEEYANFRMVVTYGIAPYVLYRSSSPVNPGLNRNREADEALNNAGIAAIINLADSEAQLREYESYLTSYYSSRSVICLNMPVDTASAAFEAGLVEGLRFMTVNDGPYLIHCNEGRDRTGFACAVLECLMGASLDEVIADYMQSYLLYYGVRPDDPKYELIAQTNIMPSLSRAFGDRDLQAGDDLSQYAAQYLISLGLSSDEIDILKDRLSVGF